jgi:NADH dehydrogenase FAD-containing subunit
MAPALEVQTPATPPVSDGEIPAHYDTKDAKELPERLMSYLQSHKSEATNGTTTTTHDVDPQTVPFNAQFALHPRKLRIATIGAGFSGLVMAHKFQHRFPELQQFVEHVIFEGRPDVGGTWFVSNYPGVQCDVPSHIYVGGI